MIDVDKIHRVLANPVRRDILRWLKDPAAHFPGSPFLHLHTDGVPIGTIHARIDLSQSTVSAHIAALTQAGLLKMHRVGQWVLVTRDEETIRRFVAALTEELTEELSANVAPAR
ncbi:ArsR/SmtB family transcription factor [Paraburkholderia rhizosphaerae]|uniref:ArsR family transcriptional regulator n=1 Tax=Paraburkholderia rhizosphaerae TaxID=480658 RepID=A0A4R8LUY6_9BURK|nr:helix-turn-helix transcriptional regulator [Paraburkholderia rhizosphaerae]TDY51599.1 ArsR family transcriptional regulator [Paraburkholderia rhizosphaerae]